MAPIGSRWPSITSLQRALAGVVTASLVLGVSAAVGAGTVDAQRRGAVVEARLGGVAPVHTNTTADVFSGVRVRTSFGDDAVDDGTTTSTPGATGTTAADTTQVAEAAAVPSPIPLPTSVPPTPAAPVTQPPAPTTTAPPRTFVEDMAHIVGRSPADTCLTVEADDRRLFQHNEDRPLIPASVMKLPSRRLAVRNGVGAKTRLTTKLVAVSRPVNGVLDGDVWMVGGGDPLLQDAVYAGGFSRQPRIHTSAEHLANLLVNAGVRQINGVILGDETRYDTQRYLPSWKASYAADGNVGPLSALTYDEGFTEYSPKRAVSEPAAHAASRLTTLLADLGTTTVGPGSVGVAPGDAIVLAEHFSTVEDAATIAVRESNNTSAELLVKELGLQTSGAGTTVAGVAAVRASVAALGLPMDGVRIVDGSGLDRGNRLTCSFLTGLLDEVGRRSALAESMAVAGRTGTLWKRFRGTPAEGRIRAKTGSLNGVTALGGYFDAHDGSVVRFAFLLNGAGSVGRSTLVNEFGAALGRHGEAGTLEGGRP